MQLLKYFTWIYAKKLLPNNYIFMHYRKTLKPKKFK